MKLIIVIAAALLIAPMAHAAAKKKKPDPVKIAKDKHQESIKTYMEGRDKNKDGSLTKEEYMESENDKGAASKAFDEANKNGDRALTKTEIGEMLGLDKELKQIADAEKANTKEKKKKK